MAPRGTTIAAIQLVQSDGREPASVGLRAVAARHRGHLLREFGQTGGALIRFTAARDALDCARAVRRADTERPNGMPAGIGIHVPEHPSRQAEAVAASLGREARPGDILLCARARDALPADAQAALAPLGRLDLAGAPAPVETFRLQEPLDTASGWEPRCLRFGGRFAIDTARFELRRDGRRVPLEPRAFDLLLLLARNSRRTVTKDEIFGTIWSDRIVSDAALSSQIKAIRQALGDDGTAQHTIATVHGRGFRFARPLDTAPPETQDAASPPAASLRRPMVAVLPLAALGPAAPTFLADGITEDLITALARNRWLGVVARNPCFAFRGSTEPLSAVGEKLGADYVVTGSVRQEGHRVRTNVEIAESRTGHALWTERFDRESDSVFDLQDEISAVIASRIAIELGIVEQQRAASRPGASRGAWEHFHLGSAAFYRFTPEENVRCQEHLREAIRLSPDFAAPHARLAYAIVLNMVYFESPVDAAAMDEALELALRAVALDDQDAQGWFTLGRVRLARREFGRAIDALEQALAIDPCLAVSHCGLGDSLAYEGRLDQAIRRFQAAIDLSPHDPFRWAFFSYRALAHLFRRDWDEAAVWARRAVQVPNAHYWAHAHLLAALGHIGDARRIEAARAELLRVRPGFTRAFAETRLFYIKRDDQLRTYLDGLARAGLP
jgi:TolB-like protein